MFPTIISPGACRTLPSSRSSLSASSPAIPPFASPENSVLEMAKTTRSFQRRCA
uniref:LRR-RLK n=1 Tax=Rhizophora mucronata TaxID=61149 RepID=A0A2P2IKB2_RHIMU